MPGHCPLAVYRRHRANRNTLNDDNNSDSNSNTLVKKQDLHMSLLHGWNCLFLFYLWLLLYFSLCNHKGAWIILQTLFGGSCLLAWQLGEPCVTTEDVMRCSSLSTPQPASTLTAFFPPSVSGAVGVDWLFFSAFIPFLLIDEVIVCCLVFLLS